MNWRKKSKKDWGRLGLISNYETRPLGELVEFVAKGIPPKYATEKTEDTIAVLNQKTNRNFKIDYKLARLNDLSKKKVSIEKMLIANDVLINSTGVGTAGRIAQLFSVPEPTTVDGHMIIVRADSDKINPIYLGYAMKAQQKVIEDLQEGSTGQTELNRHRLLNEIEISFPSDTEKQGEIASLFLSLDNRISENEKINHHLEQIAKAIFYEKFGNQVPNGLLGDLASVSSGKRPPIKVSERTATEDIPILGAASIMGYTSKSLYSEKILVTGRVGTHGIIQRYNRPCWPSDNALVLKSDDYELVYQNLLSIDFSSMNRGSTQPLITQTDLKNVAIYIPTQIELSDFEDTVGTIMQQYESNIVANESLVQLRDSLLPKLMSGEISVTD